MRLLEAIDSGVEQLEQTGARQYICLYKGSRSVYYVTITPTLDARYEIELDAEDDDRVVLLDYRDMSELPLPLS